MKYLMQFDDWVKVYYIGYFKPSRLAEYITSFMLGIHAYNSEKHETHAVLFFIAGLISYIAMCFIYSGSKDFSTDNF